jgi:hypothetical protein
MLKKRITISLLSMISILVVTSFAFVQPAQANTPSPTPTPNPTVESLEQSVGALSTQVANFETELDLNQQALEIKRKEELIPVWVAGAILAVFGISSPLVIARHLRKKIEERLDAAIYRADPTFFPIYIPKNNFSSEKERLKTLGFRTLRSYTMLSEIKPNSIVIYSAKSIEDIQNLVAFINQNELQKDQFAFVIYTSNYIEGADMIYDEFINSTLANNPVTMATHIYALARGLLA